MYLVDKKDYEYFYEWTKNRKEINLFLSNLYPLLNLYNFNKDEDYYNSWLKYQQIYNQDNNNYYFYQAKDLEWINLLFLEKLKVSKDFDYSEWIIIGKFAYDINQNQILIQKKYLSEHILYKVKPEFFSMNKYEIYEKDNLELLELYF